jgi:excisionase family DNA binding protein
MGGATMSGQILTVTLSPEQLAELADLVAARLREPQQERWLGTNEAATHLGCHPVTLRKLAAEGRIPFEQEGPGCKMYFSTRDLDAHRRGDYRDPFTKAAGRCSNTPGPAPSRPRRC